MRNSLLHTCMHLRLEISVAYRFNKRTMVAVNTQIKKWQRKNFFFAVILCMKSYLLSDSEIAIYPKDTKRYFSYKIHIVISGIALRQKLFYFMCVMFMEQFYFAKVGTWQCVYGIKLNNKIMSVHIL